MIFRMRSAGVTREFKICNMILKLTSFICRRGTDRNSGITCSEIEVKQKDVKIMKIDVAETISAQFLFASWKKEALN